MAEVKGWKLIRICVVIQSMYELGSLRSLLAKLLTAHELKRFYEFMGKVGISHDQCRSCLEDFITSIYEEKFDCTFPCLSACSRS